MIGPGPQTQDKEARPTRYKHRHRSSNRAQRRKAQANGAAHCGACQSRRVQVLRDNDTGKVIGHRCHREACRYEEWSE